MVLLSRRLKNLRNAWLLKIVRTSDPQKLIKRSEERAVNAFHEALRRFGTYRELCRAQNVPVQRITDIQNFRQHVPVIDKQRLFYPQPSSSILGDIDVRDVSSVLMSSGSTGRFSFGLSSPEEAKDSALMLEVLMDDYYQISQQKTLLINCLAQAVKIPHINVTLAEIGPRADSLGFLLKSFSSRFDQTIIIGDNYFIKNALEDAQDEGNLPAPLKLHLIVGGSYLPESLRRYLAGALHLDLDNPAKGSIYSSMGISEFGLNLFFESRETVRLRTLAYQNDAFRKKLIPADLPYLPMFFNYLPQSIHVEVDQDDVMITSLNPRSLLPLVRYKTGDAGVLVSYDALSQILDSSQKKELLPPFRSPLALIYGRKDALKWNDQNIYPQTIQEGLYREEALGRAVTGNFRLCLEDNRPCVKIQLKNGKGKHSVISLLQSRAEKILSSLTNVDLAVQLIPYEEFPFGMELDYERKFKVL